MQTLDVISVNIWQILISLSNLYLLFLIVKRFLFRPVQAVLSARQRSLAAQYAAAENAEQIALANRREWEAKMQGVDDEVKTVLQSAADQAKYRADVLINEAQNQADNIVRLAQIEADMERKRAIDSVKREIIEMSGALAEKLLEREINTNDHRNLIEDFIIKIGDGNGRNR